MAEVNPSIGDLPIVPRNSSQTWDSTAPGDSKVHKSVLLAFMTPLFGQLQVQSKDQETTNILNICYHYCQIHSENRRSHGSMGAVFFNIVEHTKEARGNTLTVAFLR